MLQKQGRTHIMPYLPLVSTWNCPAAASPSVMRIIRPAATNDALPTSAG
ncbi:MAG TPA: hypothetical protein VK674_05155 [Candidatus Limnocylindria bacterium]|nr:hypothetical protein [Candidatus Limnocylindria bacterium]